MIADERRRQGPARTFAMNRAGACGAALCSLSLALAWSGAARAELKLVPKATSVYEYQSNVFSLSSSDQAEQLNHDPTRDDQIVRSSLGLDGTYDFGLQQLLASAEGTRQVYQHFSYLDHTEYSWSGGLKWALGRTLDGLARYRQTRYIESFADIATSQRLMQTDHLSEFKFNLAVAPKWRVEGGATNDRLDSPNPDAPDFALAQNFGTLALKYNGLSHLTMGLASEYRSGDYTGSPDANSFKQITGGLTADYVVSGLSTLNGAFGYTRLTQTPGDSGSTSLFTGQLGYSRRISGKTSAKVEIGRAINRYVTNGGNEVDTTARAQVSWLPTDKLSLDLSYLWMRSSFLQTQADMTAASRKDYTRTSTLSLGYPMLRWLRLEVHGSYTTRYSSIPTNTYNAAIVGAGLQAEFR